MYEFSNVASVVMLRPMLAAGSARRPCRVLRFCGDFPASFHDVAQHYAGAEHHLNSAIAAAELLDKCPGCAGVLKRGGRPRALVDAALAEQAARVGADDEDDDDANDGGADGAVTCQARR